MRSIVGLVLLAFPTFLAAQTPTPTPVTPALDFSGVIFGNYQFRTDSAAKAALGGKSPNKFDIGRVHLNFRMPAGDRGSIRVTTDIFQQVGGAAAYYGGWTVRLKYGYFQYELSKNLAGIQGLGAAGRIGMVQNVVMEHIDGFWQRYLGQNALETHGFFASADVGASTLLTLPKRHGEIYITLLNGTGFTAAESDRFKDVAVRFSWTPFANDSTFLRTLAISPWYLKGAAASAFAAGGPIQVAPVTDGVQRDRRGIFAGVRERRFTGGAEFAQRIEGVESGANSVANPRAVRTRTSDLMSFFAFVRPAEVADPDRRSRCGLFGRYDSFDFDEVTNVSNRVRSFGAFWDLNPRATVSLDYQELRPKSGIVTVPQKTLFVHWVANF